jgi:hypothetical protein
MDSIPLDEGNPVVGVLMAVLIAIFTGCFLRLLRIQAGGILMISSAVFIGLILPGWENGVFIFDYAIMNISTLQLFLFFIACEWMLVCLSPQLKHLSGSIVDTLASHKLSAILLPALSSMAGSPRQGTAIVEESLQTDSPADRFAFIVWYRHLFTIILPYMMLPVMLSLALGIPMKSITLQLAPLFGIWLIAGLALLKGFENLRIHSHPGNKPFFKILIIPVAMLIPAIVLKDQAQLLTALWSGVLFTLIVDKEARQHLWKQRKELQIVRWLLLAAGISVWTWMFKNCSFSETQSNVQSLEQVLSTLIAEIPRSKWLILCVVPFMAGFISGLPLLCAVLISPLALCCTGMGTGNINALLPCIGFVFLGSSMSYEHLSSLSLQNQYHGSIKNIYLKLAFPFVIAGALIVVISFI